MFRFLLITACLAVPVFSYSTGAPASICSDLYPMHGVDAQSSPAPYSFSGANTLAANGEITIKLEGSDFLGFAIQARNAAEQPIGTFKVIENTKSQTLTCAHADDSLTHKKLASPITSVEFKWLPPNDYSGAVNFVGTVAKNGATFWVRKVLKTVQVTSV